MSTMNTNGSTSQLDACCNASSTWEVIGISFAAFFVLFIAVSAIRCFYERRRSAFVGPKPAPTGLEPAAIAALPTFAFERTSDDRGDGGPTECVICLSCVADGEMARLLPICTHLFHACCIEMWLQVHSTCPVCRTEVLGPADVEVRVESLAI